MFGLGGALALTKCFCWLIAWTRVSGWDHLVRIIKTQAEIALAIGRGTECFMIDCNTENHRMSIRMHMVVKRE